MASEKIEMRGLEIAGISKSYGSVNALSDVSLNVKPGELLTILGSSGSGKTTLLKIISGFEQPDAGRILLGNTDLTTIPPSKRNIGMLFQNYALFPHMSVEENIGFPLAMRKVPKSELKRRVDDALAMVELVGFGQRLPSQLSGGQQQRVALARAVLFHPSILLLDEPFGALDRKLRETMQMEVRRLQQRLGLTTIFITHDQEEALIMSDRIAVIGNGDVWQVGTPEEVYERPAAANVATFIGESNILEVRTHDLPGEKVGVETVFGKTSVPSGRKTSVSHDKQSLALIRPERVLLGRQETFPEGLGGTATIIEKIYIGLSIKYRLQTASGHELISRLEPHQPMANSAVGDTVDFAIEQSSLHLLDG